MRKTTKSQKSKPVEKWKAPRKGSSQSKFNNFVYIIIGIAVLIAYVKGG